MSNLLEIRHNKSAMVGLVLVVIMVLLALLAPVLGEDVDRLDPGSRLLAPGVDAHPLGTDHYGRDLWTVILYGAQTSLGIAAVCTIIAIVIGFLVGIICGYWSWADAILMRVMDGLMAFPNIIIVLSLVGVMGSGLGPVIFGLTVVLIPPISRVVRSSALKVKDMAMVESARSIGATDGWLLRKYVAPESVSVLIVQATQGFAATILSIAALSFLGIGLDPDDPNWGAALSAGQDYIRTAWWLGIFPGIAILVSVLGLILLGDGIRDTLDPHARRLASLTRRKKRVLKAQKAAEKLSAGEHVELVDSAAPVSGAHASGSVSTTSAGSNRSSSSSTSGETPLGVTTGGEALPADSDLTEGNAVVENDAREEGGPRA